MRFDLLSLVLILGCNARAAIVDPNAPRRVETTYSVRELATIFPKLTSGSVHHGCDLTIEPTNNSFVIRLKSDKGEKDSFDLTGAKAFGFSNDFPSADTWLNLDKVSNIQRIESVETYGSIERRLTMAIAPLGYSVSIEKIVVGDPGNKLNSILKCFFTY